MRFWDIQFTCLFIRRNEKGTFSTMGTGKILKKSVFNFEIDGLVVNIVLTEKQDQIRVPRLYFWKKLIKK